ncbi:CMP-N-acetylneuraminate-beta-galactosamide-alpha-2,3-sialyltransferase 1 isoform X3 [Oncorhynchus mykiss]|uniref:CMP-N-acetylneuraminate-beta-galactosamide- alpha-2,3-sialyltransferase 1 isoform X3 n=1 Tax=Oncorhynchus mykiss TaxID=8022 RepID=UPI00187833AE|nr:CMP-N-acetylneuraminate-beta-galactosamide-alpha-2,3-sialyltransferase 1 isoform X3 [Oncorhynchus mykiss]
MILFRIRKVRRVIVLLCITTIVVFYTGQLSSNSLVDFVKNALRPLDRILSPKYCACLKCMTQPDDDLWFQKRFNTSFQPFLTRKYKTLSNDTRMWWQKLQKDRNIANFSEVVEKLFQVIPDADLYMDAGPERCRTCAVVGNSGNLKGSHYGALIDSSDVIIRMNKARTSGYERDVGSRTTHHIIYPESAIDLDNTTSLLFFPFKTLDLQWLPGAITTGSHITFSYLRLRPKIKANKDLALSMLLYQGEEETLRSYYYQGRCHDVGLFGYSKPHPPFPASPVPPSTRLLWSERRRKFLRRHGHIV